MPGNNCIFSFGKSVKMCDSKALNLTDCNLDTFTKGLRHPPTSRANTNKIPSFCDPLSNDSSVLTAFCSTGIPRVEEALTHPNGNSSVDCNAGEFDAFDASFHVASAPQSNPNWSVECDTRGSLDFDASLHPALLEDSIGNYTKWEVSFGPQTGSAIEKNRRRGIEREPLLKTPASLTKREAASRHSPTSSNDEGGRSSSKRSEEIAATSQPTTKRVNLKKTKVTGRTPKTKSPTKQLKKKPFTCVTCNKGLATKQSLGFHRMVFHTKNPSSFPCSKCGKTFKHISRLNDHKYNHMTWKQLEKTRRFHKICYFCDSRKIYLNRTVYEDHIAVHTGEKPFNCQKCSLRLTSSSHLFTHNRNVHAAGKKLK